MTDFSTPSCCYKPDLLVLGIGNPLMGDDGVGIRVVELLANRDLPPNVSVQEAGLPGWGLPAWLEGYHDVILVDALQMGQKPGSWRRFCIEEIKLTMETGALSLHQPDLACGLALAEALDLLPTNLLVYGIEPERLDPGALLSQAVTANLTEVISCIVQDVERIVQ